MNSKRLGVIAALIGSLGFGLQHGPSLLLENAAQDGFDGMLPSVGTTGQSLVVYNGVVGIVAPLVTVGVAVGSGYFAGNRLEIPRVYRAFVGAVAVGSSVGVLLISSALLIRPVLTSNSGVEIVVALVPLASVVVSISLLVTIGALAGAAIAHFQQTTPDGDDPAVTGSHSPSATSTNADSSDSSGQTDSLH
ncbi:hypothetical protein [Natronolimnobius baerhuensis]|nr:hypothetical protein [Natronolimnobius baerhuensis]